MTDFKALMKAPEEWAGLKHDDPRLDAYATAVEAHYGLPRGLVVAIKNAGERTNPGQTSLKGAQGIMQFIPPTREKYQHNPDNPFESIDAAGRYLADSMKSYGGNVGAVIADYNGGPKQAKPMLQGQLPAAQETIQYLKRIKTYMKTTYGGGQ